MKKKLIPLALLLMMFGSERAFCGYEDDYRAGFNAAEKGNWAVVIAKMQSAINGKSKEGEKLALYGNNFVPYYPHYFLGIALAKTGNCAEGAKELAESERQGAVRSSKYYGTLSQTKNGCGESEPSKPPPDPKLIALTRQAHSEIEAARRAMKSLIDDASSRTTEAWTKDLSFESRRKEIERSIDNAEARLREGEKKGDGGALSGAIDAAKGAASQTEAIRQSALRAQQTLDKNRQDQEARKTRDADLLKQQEAAKLDATRQDAAKQADVLKQQKAEAEKQAQLRDQKAREEQDTDKVRESRELSATVERVSRYARELDRRSLPSEVQTRFDALKASLRRGQQLSVNTASVDSIRQTNRELLVLRDEVGSLLRRVAGKGGVPTPPSEPPAQLYLAATAFLRGDYGSAIKELAAPTFNDRKEMMHALAFRAASYHALYVLGSTEQGPDYLQLAITDVRACRRLDPTFSPNARAFSPRFRNFFVSEKP
ncbi:MAG TPA: hypothetical protein VHL58_17505 [Thermoanaerobaculia bacterium]|nr:hypothetical protein [Thermoanaerobaculia bacterium]